MFIRPVASEVAEGRGPFQAVAAQRVWELYRTWHHDQLKYSHSSPAVRNESQSRLSGVRSSALGSRCCFCPVQASSSSRSASRFSAPSTRGQQWRLIGRSSRLGGQGMPPTGALWQLVAPRTEHCVPCDEGLFAAERERERKCRCCDGEHRLRCRADEDGRLHREGEGTSIVRSLPTDVGAKCRHTPAGEIDSETMTPGVVDRCAIVAR